MIITCEGCGAKYKIRDSLVADGPKKTRCKKCGGEILIQPESGAPAPDRARKTPEGKAPESRGKQEAADWQEQAEGGPSAEAPPREDGKPGQGRPQQEPGEEKAETGQEQDQAGSGQQTGSGEEEDGESGDSETTPGEDIQEKLEKRRQRMEDEISGRLNKAALETLDFDVLATLAKNIKEINEGGEFVPDDETQLFACINCQTIYSLFPDDPRQCANCSAEINLIRGEDILKQYGMFG